MARSCIGARTTYTEIRRSDACREHLPALVDAAATIGAAQIQNRGTLGGNIANASPAGDTLPVLLVLDAEIVVGGPRGVRTIAAADFWVAYRRTALAPDELILRVRIPVAGGREARFRKIGTRRAQAISKVVLALAWRERGRPAGPSARGRGPTSGWPSARWPTGRSGRGRPRRFWRALDRPPRPRTRQPRRWPPRSTRSTTSARPPTTGVPSRPGPCIG